jgi:hypothetical protein
LALLLLELSFFARCNDYEEAIDLENVSDLEKHDDKRSF